MPLGYLNMPYQTGTCSSLADLKTTIEAFAQTNGWTMVNGVLNKSGVHVRFDTPADNVRFLVGTGGTIVTGKRFYSCL
jgi:hypothetical protein